MAQHFNNYKWKNRLLLVVSKPADSKALNQQLRILNSNTKGLEDRKLVIFKILPQSQKTPLKDDLWIYNDQWFQEYNTTHESFKILLIGLDGSIKHVQQTPITLEKLFSIIDAMPMRQAEMKHQP